MKRFAIVASQGFLAAGIVAMGAALLAGIDFPPQRIMNDLTGDVGRMVIGGIEIVAGLCLLVPRGHVIGTFLLAMLTVGLIGLIIGRSTDGSTLRFAAPRPVTAVYSTDTRACEGLPGAPLHLTAPREHAI